MNLFHIFPENEVKRHVFALPTDCFCEPEVRVVWNVENGMPIKVVVHQKLDRMLCAKKMTKIRCA